MPHSTTSAWPCANHWAYPAAEWFAEAFDARAVRAWLAAGGAPHWRQPIALNISMPAPHGAECACDRADCVQASICVAHLEQEMALYHATRGERATVVEMRWSAGVTARPKGTLERLRTAVDDHFERSPRSSFSAVVEPEIRAGASLPALRELGVTSLCVIFENDWSAATAYLAAARDMGFVAVEAKVCAESNGTSLGRQLDALIASKPTRIVLPSARMHSAASRLLDAGYVCIARNVLAIPADSHAIAHRQGRLTRQPYGYSSRPVGAVLALGQQAIGYIGPLYYQNHRLPRHYFSALGRGKLPVERGLHLTHEDLTRLAVIGSLSANLFVDIAAIEAIYKIDFRQYFDVEWKALSEFLRIGVLTLDSMCLALTPTGRLCCDDVCRVFDQRARFLAEHTPQPGLL